MIRILFTLILSLSSLVASVIEIDENSNALEVLPNASIYIDNTKKLTLEEVKKKKFQSNSETFLAYGYAPPFSVWVKFILKNNTDKTISKILQYDHEITSHIEFFDGEVIHNDGINNLSQPRHTTNPIFNITLNPNEKKTYYLKTKSYITPLTIKLNLWQPKVLYINEINHQLALALFFGAMGILLLYNFFIYLSVRDVSYLYYVLYILGAIVHHIFYSGLVYRFEINTFIEFLGTRGAYIIVTGQFIALILFTKYFLQTSNYSKINKIANFYLVTIPIMVAIGIYQEYTSGWQNIFYLSSIIFLFIVACYLSYKRNRQAYFIVSGWLVLFATWIFMYTINIGVFDHNLYSFYLVEIGILGEALIFSFALADRIKIANREKELANAKLIAQQQTEEQRLQKEVDIKTHDLTQALSEKDVLLDEKELLFKELHHRVKNNMQMVISMLRLQSKRLDDEKLQSIFQTAQNRISTMAHLHELLYKQDNITHINTQEYFMLLIDELQESTHKDIKINYNIRANLKMEQAIYCGLILNELVSNSMKYAFENSGQISISLIQQNNLYELIVSDNGKGFDVSKQKDSLGLILVNTLATKQLKGEIVFETNQGTTVKIVWSANEQS